MSKTLFKSGKSVLVDACKLVRISHKGTKKQLMERLEQHMREKIIHKWLTETGTVRDTGFPLHPEFHFRQSGDWTTWADFLGSTSNKDRLRDMIEDEAFALYEKDQTSMMSQTAASSEPEFIRGKTTLELQQACASFEMDTSGERADFVSRLQAQFRHAVDNWREELQNQTVFMPRCASVILRHQGKWNGWDDFFNGKQPENKEMFKWMDWLEDEIWRVHGEEFQQYALPEAVLKEPRFLNEIPVTGLIELCGNFGWRVSEDRAELVAEIDAYVNQLVHKWRTEPDEEFRLRKEGGWTSFAEHHNVEQTARTDVTGWLHDEAWRRCQEDNGQGGD